MNETEGIERIPGKKRSYNPNRFNASDSGMVYLIALIVFYGISLLFGKIFAEPLRSLYRYDTYAYLIVNIGVSQSAVFLVALIYSRIRRVNTFCGGGYIAKFDGVQVLMSIILIMGIMMTFYHVHLQFSSDAETILGEAFSPDINLSPLSPVFALIYIAMICICPAIFEEMLFRGIVMRGLEQFGNITAVVLSALMFALMHGNFSQLILQFIGGLAIGGVVMITKNYLSGSIMHAFNNFYSVVYGVLTQKLGEDLLSSYLQVVTDAALIVIGVACLVISLIYFGKMLVDKKKREWEGKPPVNRFDKVKTYEFKENGEPKTAPYYEIAEMRLRGEEDGRTFSICGKERKLNRKSACVPAFIVLGLSIFMAIVFMFV